MWLTDGGPSRVCGCAELLVLCSCKLLGHKATERGLNQQGKIHIALSKP
jgi:hypothetical protein